MSNKEVARSTADAPNVRRIGRIGGPVEVDALRTALALGREQRGVEFKGPGLRTDKPFLAKVVRATIGMANTPDGGTVIIGVAEKDDQLDPIGLRPDEIATWGYDDLHANVTNYADPFVEFDVGTVQMDGKQFIAIDVVEFAEMPVICKRDYADVLRDGALYVRRRGKNETVEVPSHVEMREVIERASEKSARRMLATVARLVPGAVELPEESASAQFDAEVEDLL